MREPSIDVLEIRTSVIWDNDVAAARVHRQMEGQGMFFVNLMASPGAGKTTTLVRTIEALRAKYRIGVMEADVDSTVDAETIAQTGARVIQIHNGGACHMDADMTLQGIERLGTEGLDVLFLENIGNLVCPAEFDVGATASVMILSVPEGDDKPLKYPLMFSVSDCLLVNKLDTLPVFDFDMDALRARTAALNPDCAVFPLSSLTGEGFDSWLQWLTGRIEAFKAARKGMTT